MPVAPILNGLRRIVPQIRRIVRIFRRIVPAALFDEPFGTIRRRHQDRGVFMTFLLHADFRRIVPPGWSNSAAGGFGTIRLRRLSVGGS